MPEKSVAPSPPSRTPSPDTRSDAPTYEQVRGNAGEMAALASDSSVPHSGNDDERREACRRRLHAVAPTARTQQKLVFELLGMVQRSEGRAVNADVDALDQSTREVREEVGYLTADVELDDVSSLESRIGAVEATVAQNGPWLNLFMPYISYHRSLEVGRLRVIRSLTSETEARLAVAVEQRRAAEAELQAAQEGLQNAELASLIAAALQAAGAIPGPIGLGVSAMTMAMNGPDMMGAAGAFSASVGLMEATGKVAKRLARVQALVDMLSLVAQSAAGSNDARSDRLQRMQKVQYCAEAAMNAARNESAVLVEANANLREAQAIAAKADGAYSGYQAGF